MNDTTTVLRFLGPIAISLVLGCAPAYHNYSGCYVDCHYCPPPPLPYAHYSECVCHSCAAQPYLHAVVDAAAPSGDPDELEAPQPLKPHQPDK